jgi:two-component system OmpR family sensor kinase
VSRLSLRLRLTLAFAAAMALLLTATGVFLYVRLGDTLDSQLDQSLRARADDVTALVRRGDSGLDEPQRRLAESDESFAQVLGGDGGVRDATPGIGTAPLLTPDEVRRARAGTLVVERDSLPRLENEPARLLATPVDANGEAVVVVSGVSLGDRNEALAGLRTQLLVGVPVALLLASLAGWGLATAALRPVEAMRRRAEEISASTAGHRLPVPPADDEIGRLARTLNEMLGRLEAGLARERRFVADASHELRTPLSLLRAELELALRRPRTAEELQGALASAAEETERLVRLANDLLLLATADEGQLRLDRRELDVRELLAGVAERFAARAQAAGRPLDVSVDEPLVVDGDRLRLEQALGNLVDNALRYGAGPVRLEAARANGFVALAVRDDGDGFPPDYMPRAFERFSRADDARSGAGAGLGLALVDAVARAHGGRAFARNGGAGTRIGLVVPR